jgi:hypothetical protein
MVPVGSGEARGDAARPSRRRVEGAPPVTVKETRMNPAEAAARTSVLETFGARGTVVEELLEYNRNVFDTAAFDSAPALPLPDEAHVATWREYVEDAAARGVLPALRERLVQLRFPIEAGVSQTPEYLAATRRGEAPATGEGLALERPDQLRLQIHETPAGAIPVLVAPWRSDFERLVQAFVHRNEPKPIPASMGACIVSGLNNWSRVAAHRRRWESEGGDPAGWPAELQRLVPHKERYQDRFVVLSAGYYSAVEPAALGLEPELWLRRSLVVRRDHECTHYFTLRVLGAMRNNLLDELIADYVGLVAAFGSYSPRAAMLFLGVGEGEREGGRIHNYRGQPALSDEAFAVLRRIVGAAIQNLGELNAAAPDRLREPAAIASTILALARRSLDQLATPAGAPRLAEILA